MHQWLLPQFLVLLMMDAGSVRNMQSDLAVTNKQHCKIWFQTFAVFCMLYALFWVITRCLEFKCWSFGTLYLFHLHMQVDVSRITLLTSTCLWRWNRQSVPKRQHINSRRRVITQNKAYNIQNTAKAWNQEKQSHVYTVGDLGLSSNSRPAPTEVRRVTSCNAIWP